MSDANWSAADVAARAGVDVDDVERMVALGILPRGDVGFGPGDVRKVHLALACERAGRRGEGASAAGGGGGRAPEGRDRRVGAGGAAVVRVPRRGGLPPVGGAFVANVRGRMRSRGDPVRIDAGDAGGDGVRADGA